MYLVFIIITHGLVKAQQLSPTLRIFDSVDLKKGPRIPICNKLPGDADAAGHYTTLWEPLDSRNFACKGGHEMKQIEFEMGQKK